MKFIRFGVLCLLGLFVVTTLKSEIPVVALKGMTSSITQPDKGVKQNYVTLSPALGALYWNSPFFKNIYLFAPASDPLKKLVTELFHVHVDGSFDVTRLYLKLAFYFDATIIGDLAGPIYHIMQQFASLDEEAKKTKRGYLIQNLQLVINNYITLDFMKAKRDVIQKSFVHHHQLKLESLEKELQGIELEIYSITEDAIRHGVAKRDPRLNVLLLNEKKLRTQTEHMRESIAKEREAIERKTDEILTSNDKIIIEFMKNVQSFGELVATIVNGELDGDYPFGMTIATLLAFLWKKCDDVEQLRLYLDSVARNLKIKPEDLYAWPSPMTEYTYEDYKRLQSSGRAAIANFSIDDLIFVRLAYDLYDNPLPPKVSMIGNAVYQGIEFPDCGETSLRNLLNVLSYDQKARVFNLDIIKALQQESSSEKQPTVLDFYRAYPSTTKIKDRNTHNAWADVVSELPGRIEYNKRNKCDIDGAFNNMMNVIHALFPEIRSLQDMATRLKQYQIEMIIDESNLRDSSEKKDRVGSVLLKIKKPPYFIEFPLTWHFWPHHFELDFPLEKYTPFSQGYMVPVQSNVYDFTPVKIFILSLFGDDLELKSSLFVSRHGSKPGFPYLYLFPLDTDKQKIEVATTVNEQGLSEVCKEFILNLSNNVFKRHDSSFRIIWQC